MNEPIICTIITKNYLAHARTLAQTFLQYHPAGRVFVLLIDKEFDNNDFASETFTPILINDLNIPRLRLMLFRYTMFELSCALKPYLLEYLFKKYGFNKICYFDSDFTINDSLDEIFTLLDSKLLILTPHLLDFLEDGQHPDEQSILQAGAYNAGFIGVAQHPELERFLQWWQRRLEKYSVVDVSHGLFTDQRWLDLAPGFFADVYIHRDPGCNVSYWNLNHRHIEQTPTGYKVNDSPLKFFHFSGFSIENIETISAHQTRYTLREIPHLRSIYKQYRDLLIKNGYYNVKNLACPYDFFDNGIRIPPFARYLWREVDEDGQRWPDPINTYPKDSFINWLNAPADNHNEPLITHLALELYHRRPDLQQVFPNIFGGDRLSFAEWFVRHGHTEGQIDSFFIEPVAVSLNQTPKTQPTFEKTFTQPKVATEMFNRQQLTPGARLYLPIRDFLNRVGVGPRIKAAIGSEQVWKVRQLFFYANISENNRNRAAYISPRPLLTEIQSVKTDLKQASKLPFGLNVIGYLQDEIGVGEVARSVLKALDYKNFPVAQVSISNKEALSNDTSTSHLPSGNPYSINLCNINADGAPVLYQALGQNFFQNRYNIGFWFWELAQFPMVWQNSFSYFDEIWVGSTFVQEAIAPSSPIPVINVRVPFFKPVPSNVTRADLGLPDDKHIFLFVFDGLSYAERKNPLDLIRAYRNAFEPHFRDTVLVIKAAGLHRNPEIAQCLREEIESISGILIERYLSRNELTGLFQACDTYVSLHRSEGFGLTMAEAMSLGKPVIATAYSANMDFMSQNNSYPVSYRLVEIEEDYGPYQKGNQWAAPDIAEAAALMKHVVANPEEAQRKGLLAQQDIEQIYGIEVVSGKIIKRLEMIHSWQ